MSGSSYTDFHKTSESAVRIVPYSNEPCSETDPSILQHKRAPCQLISRFSPTNHQDSHFHEESLEKVFSLPRGTLLSSNSRITRVFFGILD